MEIILFIKLDPKNEADVICWMNSLPPRTINKTVNEIVVAETSGQIARVPYEFSYTNEVEPLRCRLIFRNRTALDFLAKIPKGEYKSALVKTIRRHIQTNKELKLDLFTINRDYLYVVAKKFIKEIEKKKLDSKGVPDRTNKLIQFYTKAFNIFFHLSYFGYKSVDENMGDYKLYNLNYRAIVNKTFSEIFGELPKSANENSNKLHRVSDDNSINEKRGANNV